LSAVQSHRWEWNRVCQVKQPLGEIRGNESGEATEIPRISILLLAADIANVTKPFSGMVGLGPYTALVLSQES
jgi:hypothetical protein